jgi:hypothetical protein
MKLTLLLLVCASTAMAAEEAIPLPYPGDRYSELIARSPFALATPVAPPAPVTAPGYAEGWYVSGLAQFEGKDYVTIKSRDLSVQFSLFGTEPNDQNGVALQQVEWSPTIGRSTVMIVKDGQSAKLEFNQAEAQAAPAQSMPIQRGAAPGMYPGRPPSVGSQPGMIRPQVSGVGDASSLNPNNPASMIPRPARQLPVVSGQPVGKPTFNVPTPDPRRRIRVINNTPAQ